MNDERPADATATVSVKVAVTPDVAFAVFTEETDLWWRRGPKFRHAAGAPGTLRIEPGLGGRVVEAWTQDGNEREFELGRVTVWEPPARLAFSWRNGTFVAVERTDVEITFVASGNGTLVTVRHRGWESLRADHPARHGMADAALARSCGMWWGDLMTALREFAAQKTP